MIGKATVVTLGLALLVATAAAWAGKAPGAAYKVSNFTLNVHGGAAASLSKSDGPQTVVSPKQFSLLALSWRGEVKGRSISVRVRGKDGNWSGWHRLSVATDHGPDNASGSRRIFTDPAWAGEGMRVVQLRGTDRLRELRVHFVRVADGRSRVDRIRNGLNSAFVTVATSAGRLVGLNSASAEPTQPAIIPRSQWAKDKCKPHYRPSYGTVKMAFVHHTVSINDYTAEEAPKVVLSICNFHRKTRGWSDIGYNFLVDRYGQIFEGRAGGITAAVAGAQAQGYNSISTGISNIGEFTEQGQSGAGLQALSKLLAWKLSLSGVKAAGRTRVVSIGGGENRYPAGRSVRLQRVSGHRDGDKTDCPGNALYDELGAIRKLTAALQRSNSKIRYILTGHGPAHPVTAGTPAVVSGALAAAANGSVTNRAIELEVRRDGGWQKLSEVQSDTLGSWTATLSLTENTTLRAVYRPEPGSAVHSRSFKVKVS